jgi:glucan phosphoethanolaminetransferase (alkaline phosphatase superfamily)
MAFFRKRINFISKIAIFLILSTIVIWIYSKSSGSDRTPRLLFYHILVLASCLVFLLIIGWIILLTKINTWVLNWFFGVICGLFFTTLIVTYALAFVGDKIIGVPIRFQVFWLYLMHPTDTIHALGLSPFWAYTLSLGLPILIILFFVYNSQYILGEVSNLQTGFVFFIKSKSVKNKLLKISIFLFFIFAGLTSIHLLNKISLTERLEFVREPLFQVYFGANIMGITLSKNLESPAVRKQYPKNILFYKKNIILIIVDALRADYLSLYGYPQETSPFLSQLYKEGSLRKIDYTFSTSSVSFPGILSILRSKSWNGMGQTNFSLPELFKDQGYRVNFILSGDHKNFYRLKMYYGNSIDSYFDGTDFTNFFLNDDLLLFEGLSKIPNYQNNPSFFYFHLMSVHSAGIRHDESLKYLPASSNRLSKQSYQNNYKDGIIQADGYIKNIFEQLGAKGYLKNSIVVITADHGESVGEDGIFAHANTVSNREIYIPLLIYDTDTSIKYVRNEFAIQPDIAATIVDRLGLPIPKTWEGKSLLHKEYSPFTFHCINNSYAIINYQRDKIFKYSYNTETQKEEVFELKSDLHEMKNVLLGTEKALLTEFRGKMKKFVLESKRR